MKENRTKRNMLFLKVATSSFLIIGSLANASSVQQLPKELKTRIMEEAAEGKKEKLKNFGEVSKDFNQAMKEALQTHKVHIKASQLTPDNVETLKKVGDLDLSIDQGDNNTIVLISKLENLRSLNLYGAKIPNEGLKHVSQLKNLRSLDLSSSNITDSDLRYVSQLKNLQELHLSKTNITDAGLKHVSQLKNLRVLSLQGTKISYKGLQELLKSLPELETDEDAPDFPD